MTFMEFITEIWLLIQEYARHPRIEEGIEAVRRHMNGARDRVVAWWRYGLGLTLATLSMISLLLFIGFIAGLYSETGAIANALTGIIIAPLILLMLAWWTPIAAVIGIASEVVHGNFKSALLGGIKGTETWLKIIRGILLWQLIMSFVLAILPYRNAPLRVPIIALSVLLVVMMGSVWGSGKWYRTVIRGTVYCVLTANIIFCFWPQTARTIHSRLEKADQRIAQSIASDGVVGGIGKELWAVCFGASEAEASGSMMEVKVFSLPASEKMTLLLESGAMTEVMQSPTGKLAIESTDGGFNFLTLDGRLIRSYERNRWPVNEPFQIVAVTKQRLTIDTGEVKQ